MRSPVDMDTIQIEVTNACVRNCSNCTRFCGHHEHTYFMEFDQFKEAVDSLVGFPKMVGMMGGEPLLHPEFERMCEYMRSKFKPEQLGLWTAFPIGYHSYRDAVCATFGNLFLNDHSRPDIFHHPLMVAANEVLVNENEILYLADHCWVQNAWSASINPHGAFFCEVAAAWSMLLNEEHSCGWKVEPGWWWRTPIEFTEQVKHFCMRCGGALPLQKRSSQDIVDDISPKNLELLKDRSPKLKRGQYRIHDLRITPKEKQLQMAAYKDFTYRERLARHYGIFLQVNEKGFISPYLMKGGIKPFESLFDQCVREYQDGK